MTMKDDDGQPINKALNRNLRIRRDIDELLGICRGLAADGKVNLEEARFLEGWLKLNPETAQQWPAKILSERLRRILADGLLDQVEERELLALLVEVTGGDPSCLTASSLTSKLPLNDPLPRVTIGTRHFCFTGKFLYGSRDTCHEAVIRRGGVAVDSITQHLDFLVIGVIGSRDWLHSVYGTKIKKAVDYRDSGVPLAIIAEEHFVKALAV